MATESINDFAIKMGVDATGVATGMAAANAVILQSQREISKAEAVEREINLQQKIESEEKFSKWYSSELDREFQAWYKVEQQKETILQEEAANRQRIAHEAAVNIQQANINTHNAAIDNERRLTTTIAEETQKQIAFSRQLQEAVIARYAAQDAAEEAQIAKADAETQGVMDTAWNRIVAQQRATLAAFYAEKDRLASESAQHTLRVTEQERKWQELQEADRIKALREDIQAAYAHAAERDKISKEQHEQELERQERRVQAAYKAQKRIQEDAARFRAGAGAGDMQASTVGGRIPVSAETIRVTREYVREVETANRLEKEAIGLRAQLMTATQLHAMRLAQYDAMLNANIITQVEHANAVAYSTRIMNASGNAFGGAAMAMGQASYAVEDFIQVLSMGGGLNMALMSASNNLSMVARSMMGAQVGMAAIAGIGIPAILIGLGMLTRYLTDSGNAIDKVTEALEPMRKEQENIGKMTALRHKFQDESQQIQDMQSREEVERKITDLKIEQAKLDEVMAQEETKRQANNAAAFTAMLGGQDAIIEFQEQINKSMIHGTQQQKIAAQELSRLLGEARQHAIAGNEQAMFESLRNLHSMMTRMDVPQLGIEGIDVGFMDNFKALFNDPELLDSVQNLFNPNMMDLQENMKLQEEIAEKLLSQDEHMTEERQRQLEIVQKMLEAQEQMIQVEGQADRSRQQRMRDELEMLRMSDAEREAKRLRDEQAAFSGIDTDFVGPQMPLDEIAAAQEFMDLQLAQINKEIDQLKQPSYAQGLEQNTYDAQAKAFEQMFKAKFGPADPQVERLDTLITIQQQLLDQGAQAPRVQVIP